MDLKTMPPTTVMAYTLIVTALLLGIVGLVGLIGWLRRQRSGGITQDG